eukprot:COSAG02_NODE_11834_length_1645_cov_1.043984_1_plen_162_part_00
MMVRRKVRMSWKDMRANFRDVADEQARVTTAVSVMARQPFYVEFRCTVQSYSRPSILSAGLSLVCACMYSMCERCSVASTSTSPMYVFESFISADTPACIHTWQALNIRLCANQAQFEEMCTKAGSAQVTGENYAGVVVTEERVKWSAVLSYWREESEDEW